MKAEIMVRSLEVQYNKEATRWLEVWLDSMLTLNDHTKKTFAKARRTQNRVRSLMTKKGFSSEACRRIQVGAVQAGSLYGAELWWKGQKN